MVGSVLMDRMRAEGDFALIEPVFFSTSKAGGALPAAIADLGKNEGTLQDAHDIAALKRCDIIITCQGGDYTQVVYPQLRAATTGRLIGGGRHPLHQVGLEQRPHTHQHAAHRAVAEIGRAHV